MVMVLIVMHGADSDGLLWVMDALHIILYVTCIFWLSYVISCTADEMGHDWISDYWLPSLG